VYSWTQDDVRPHARLTGPMDAQRDAHWRKEALKSPFESRRAKALRYRGVLVKELSFLF
jgi:hypothetical protein